MKTVKILAQVLVCSFFALTSHAQTVEKIKNTICLINMEGQNLPIGAEYVTVNDVGRKTGLIQIKQVKGNKAIGTILKGIVVAGEKLEPKPIPKSRFAEEPTTEDITIRRRQKSYDHAGVLFGYSMDSMSFTGTDSGNTYSENVSLSGTSLKIKGFYDFPWQDIYVIRLIAGLDGFNGKYTAKNSVINKDGSSSSTLSVSYLGGTVEIQWPFYKKNNTNYWMGAGYSLEYAISSSTNIYSLTMSSALASVYSVSGGANFPSNGNQIIPVYIKYNYYNSGVPQTSLEFGGGWGTVW